MHYGVELVPLLGFSFYYIATGTSITLGYHRLFSHKAFKAKWPVKLFVLIFGAAAFENSALGGVPNIATITSTSTRMTTLMTLPKDFWWAHIGWLMFKLKPDTPDGKRSRSQKDPLVMWQHKGCIPSPLSLASSFQPHRVRIRRIFQFGPRDGCSGRFPHSGCRPYRHGAACYFLHQFALPHDRLPPLLDQSHGSGQLDCRHLHHGGRIPQLSPRVSMGIIVTALNLGNSTHPNGLFGPCTSSVLPRI